MIKTIISTLSITLAIATAPYAVANEPLNALSSVKAFYKKLLSYKYASHTIRPEMKFSTSLAAEVQKNSDICKKYAPGDVCGWGANGDIYLDTQEIDPILSYKNSGIKLKEIAAGTIEVKLNVYPSEGSPYYDKTIIYKMKKENNMWVADDIAYGDGRSARAYMKKENASYTDKPAK